MNLVNLQDVSLAYGPLVLLDSVSLGIDEGDRIGVVGRNGGGKSTLMAVLAGRTAPDSGRVVHNRGLRIGFLAQRDAFPDASVAAFVLGERAEHEWAGDARVRDVLRGLLSGWDLDAPMSTLSGGERRRAALARLLIDSHDLIVLDEPTNHLDIEAIAWLAEHLRRRREALAVVTHDRWFLDAVTNRTWEVVDGRVERYEGGYAAYVLAKAERARLAAAAEERRQNLMRKELAWLRRGPPARTSKPKFRIDAANSLIADVPPVRDTVELVRFASSRLGKTVIDATDLTLTAGPTTLIDRLTWQLGPGDRIGLVGVNGSGKTTLLRALAGEREPDAGRVRHGKTVNLAHLSQNLAELAPDSRPLQAVEEVRRHVTIGDREFTASQMLERFGFRGERQWTPVGELSGGERRRLQLLRLLMNEPNVLLLDEPTNDLDIETLTELEDLLDGWPGSLVLVSHDRYFLERITDRVLALMGDGRLLFLPGGVDEYLSRRAEAEAGASAVPSRRSEESEAAPAAAAPALSAAERRAVQKEVQRVERRLDRIAAREAELHEQMARAAEDYVRLAELDSELKTLAAEKAELEEIWLAEAEKLNG
ncbi:ABC-F family ATP-binding cassette domain-containing protein [Streptomonospora nanhaiensis]|uniref:ATP-binding cassette subfamily F protein uup n=1 Tax=Streptomonospora nanhaiensis TaxID=1323731 RepID=A0A853BNZ3_9ACTN|nr:ABC-F family ATP-binding cassette domain-containing protein [Streptomonospora nanhaiensis]MBV2362014.1 ABC-F family ATP-binding cassette domain-containing protein [Streptomonospora nanhaiensis]MBX9386753.1 ABC-F family ATP-binding cassette domain-containing protein [Streptomonospora nanhaiensis]NYI96162.1 ATP-binding cassette subfamily F protein uup [Streptomonospora nanhaiensis]